MCECGGRGGRERVRESEGEREREREREREGKRYLKHCYTNMCRLRMCSTGINESTVPEVLCGTE